MGIGDGDCWQRMDPPKVSTKSDTAPRHYLVLAELLERAALKLRANQNGPDVIGDLVPILEIFLRRL